MATILITGASQRLGLYLVRHYCQSEHQVFAISRQSSSDLKQLETQGVKVIEIGEYSEQGAELAAKIIASCSDRLDLLVNNASAFVKDPLDQSEANLYRSFFDTHMLFPFCLTSRLADLLSAGKNTGLVVNMTDIYSNSPKSDHALYSSTKAGLANLTMGLAKRYKDKIRVNAIAPGPIKFLDSHSESEKNQILGEALLQKEGGFESILKTLEFFVTNDYLTGTTINVDGGRSINCW